MARYQGKDVDVRIATGTAEAATATPVPYLMNIEWGPQQNIRAFPKGLGQGRATELHEGLLQYTGRLNFDYDTTEIEGGSILSEFFQSHSAEGTVSLTKRTIRVTVGATGHSWILRNVLGQWRESIPDVDALAEQSLDIWFESLEISKT